MFEEDLMAATTISGIVSKGVIVPSSPLPEGTRVEIHLLAEEAPKVNPARHFPGHLDSNHPIEQSLWRNWPAGAVKTSKKLC
jgi:hypothetical protein